MVSEKVLLELIRTHAQALEKIHEVVSRHAAETNSNYMELKAAIDESSRALVNINTAMIALLKEGEAHKTFSSQHDAKTDGLIVTAKQSLATVLDNQTKIKEAATFSAGALTIVDTVRKFIKKPIGAVVFFVSCLLLIVTVLVSVYNAAEAASWLLKKITRPAAVERHSPTGTTTNDSLTAPTKSGS